MAPEAHARLRGLYAITPTARATDRLLRDAAEVLDGGASILQFRAKGADPALALAQARSLRGLCRDAGALFIVNDSVALALEVDADGAHLGRDDGDLAQARAALGGRILGVSCYDQPDLAVQAARSGADYVALGSVFASPTKPGAVACAASRLAEAATRSGLPVAAIGGITIANAPRALAAGADMLAVVSALFDAPDPRAAARGFARLFLHQSSNNDHARSQPRTL